MAEIRPFRGLRYNSSKIKDLAPVLCPPYDIISSADQQRFHEKSPYNVIRLEQALAEGPEEKYSSSACLLKQWREEGVLQPEAQPAFYLHQHQFTFQGKKWQRRGLMTRVRLEGRDTGGVRPHEGTLAAPKNDRLRLLRACQANISPIFALYQDESNQLSALLAAQENRPPTALASADSGESHQLWAISDPELMTRLQSSFKSLSLYIADGHHRYETALTYREERRRSLPSFNEEEAFNFVMMTLVDTSDPGLLILPVHRLVRGVAPEAMAGLKDKLRSLFHIEEHALGGADVSRLERLLGAMKQRGQTEMTMGLYGLEPDIFLLLSRREAPPVELMPPHATPAYRNLEVAVLRHLVLEDMLEMEEDKLTYTPLAAEALGQVTSGKYQLAFFLNPLAVDKLQAVADVGERLPGKSTYFYPKLPTGLVINPLE